LADEYQLKSSRVKSSIRIAENSKTSSSRTKRFDRSRSPLYRSSAYSPPPPPPPFPEPLLSSSRSRRDVYTSNDYHDRRVPPPPPPIPYGSLR
jgi:hypothetical protein